MDHIKSHLFRVFQFDEYALSSVITHWKRIQFEFVNSWQAREPAAEKAKQIDRIQKNPRNGHRVRKWE